MEHHHPVNAEMRLNARRLSTLQSTNETQSWSISASTCKTTNQQNHRVAICPFSHVGFLVPFERLQLHLKRSKFVSLLSLGRLIHVSGSASLFLIWSVPLRRQHITRPGKEFSPQSKNKYNPYCHHTDHLLCLALDTRNLLIVRPGVATLRCLLVYFIAFSFTQQAHHLPFPVFDSLTLFLKRPIVISFETHRSVPRGDRN